MGVLATRLIEEGVDCTVLDSFTEDQYYPERVRSLPHIQGDILWDNTFLSKRGAGTYDLVTCFEMLEHYTDQLKCLQHIYTMLKEGGCLVGTFPIPGMCHAEDDHHVTFLTVAELKDKLISAGFIDVAVEPTGSIIKEEKPCSFYFKARK